eukprot:COSAG01_NODE_3308_length_6284_cov_32.195473_4_plen_317_part_00
MPPLVPGSVIVALCAAAAAAVAAVSTSNHRAPPVLREELQLVTAAVAFCVGIFAAGLSLGLWLGASSSSSSSSADGACELPAAKPTAQTNSVTPLDDTTRCPFGFGGDKGSQQQQQQQQAGVSEIEELSRITAAQQSPESQRALLAAPSTPQAAPPTPGGAAAPPSPTPRGVRQVHHALGSVAGRTGAGAQRTMLLTGASRGIGHGTVKLFLAAGWRVLTCSRTPYSSKCPWRGGAENHIVVDLADADDTARAIDEIRSKLQGWDPRAHACARPGCAPTPSTLRPAVPPSTACHAHHLSINTYHLRNRSSCICTVD